MASTLYILLPWTYGSYKVEGSSFDRLWNGFNIEIRKTRYNYMKIDITWFTIISHSQSPRALFQTLQPPNSITSPQHKKIYRFLCCSLLQRSLQPFNKFVYYIQPCCTFYNAVNPTDRPTHHLFRPTFYLAVIVRPPSVQLNPIYSVQRISLQPVHMSF